MNLTEDTLRELFVEPEFITADRFQIDVVEAKRRSESLERRLVASGALTAENFGKTIAEYAGFEFANLADIPLSTSVTQLIPADIARAHRITVIASDADSATVATEHPDDIVFLNILARTLHTRIIAKYAVPTQMDVALRVYKGDQRQKLHDEVARAEGDVIGADIREVIDTLLTYAHDTRASDVHIEPGDDVVIVRCRVDGLLAEVCRYDKALHDKIVFRIKIMAHMRTDEHGAAQDGRIAMHESDEPYEIRASVLPVTNGENIVLRILDHHAEQYSLETIGLSESDYQKVIVELEKPHGMILAVGPTGCGKTTVLYSILERLNRPDVNITTIEDPVEYQIEGIQQIQVNPATDLSFAHGLRAIVRQDPDIVMVGEVRDEETADIAINSALTGHLVLSTLHTNDAATTFPRLLEMRIEPFLVASSVRLVIALRLVRRVCTHCKASHRLNPEEKHVITSHQGMHDAVVSITGASDALHHIRAYRGAGCVHCNHTGFLGRIGIFEVISMTEELRMAIIERASSEHIMEIASAGGMTGMTYDGIRKALEGVTTFEEVMYATRT